MRRTPNVHHFVLAHALWQRPFEPNIPIGAVDDEDLRLSRRIPWLECVAVCGRRLVRQKDEALSEAISPRSPPEMYLRGGKNDELLCATPCPPVHLHAIALPEQGCRSSCHACRRLWGRGKLLRGDRPSECPSPHVDPSLKGATAGTPRGRSRCASLGAATRCLVSAQISCLAPNGCPKSEDGALTFHDHSLSRFRHNEDGQRDLAIGRFSHFPAGGGAFSPARHSRLCSAPQQRQLIVRILAIRPYASLSRETGGRLGAGVALD